MPGYELDTKTLNSLSNFLNNYLNKPEGITVRKHSVAASCKIALTLSELVRLERTYCKAYTYGNVITVQILITDSEYIDDDVFATSYWNTSF